MPQQIEWRCSKCDDNGVISGWAGTPWDRSSTPPAPARGALEVRLGAPEYEAVLAAHVLDPAAHAIVLRARRTARGLVLAGSVDDLEELRDYVAAAANHERSPARRRRLDAAYEALAEALGWTF